MYPKWMDSRPVHHQKGVRSREFQEAEAIHTCHLRWMVFPIIIVTGILPNNVFIFFKPPHISKILSSSTCKTWLGPGRACWCSSRAWHAIVSQIHFHTCLKQPAVQSGCQSNVQLDGGARAGAIARNIPDNWGDLQSSPSIANCMHECRMTCTFCQRVELPSGEAPIGKVSVWEETVSNND